MSSIWNTYRSVQHLLHVFIQSNRTEMLLPLALLALEQTRFSSMATGRRVACGRGHGQILFTETP